VAYPTNNEFGAGIGVGISLYGTGITGKLSQRLGCKYSETRQEAATWLDYA